MERQKLERRITQQRFFLDPPKAFPYLHRKMCVAERRSICINIESSPENTHTENLSEATLSHSSAEEEGSVGWFFFDIFKWELWHNKGGFHTQEIVGLSTYTSVCFSCQKRLSPIQYPPSFLISILGKNTGITFSCAGSRLVTLQIC